MRLVLVHGRAQGRRSQRELLDEWVPALRRGVEAAGGPPLPDGLDVRLPFYGAELDRLVDTPPPGEYVARGDGGEPAAVEAELLLTLVARAGVTDAQIAAEAGDAYVERGPQNWGWVRAAARALTRHVPWLSDVALRDFVRDVSAYLTRVDVTKAVNDIVSAEVGGGGPAVVVAHSLGSIVAYEVLTALGDGTSVPLFLTVGSPLGIPVVKQHLPRPLGRPRCVGQWLNGADERDPVALYPRLDRDTFPAEIENVSDVHNPRDNAHGIAGYLSDTTLAKRIAAAVGAP